jgi:glycosyltransferase involved in cell wall biosynthesis
MLESEAVIENPLETRSVDIVVGIPSYNEADNIGFVVKQVAGGLREYFSGMNNAIINADNFSEDGTRQAFLNAESHGVHKTYLSTTRGVKGKGNNLHNLYRYLLPHQPAAILVVDADLQSIRPEWVGMLAEPILSGYDFVSPSYVRNEYDGTITNHLCYPLLYGVLGKNIRQPIGGDFAFSFQLMKHWLTRPWNSAVREYGVDIFMTLEAILAGFSMAQVVLGSKIHKPSQPKLGTMFAQVVATLFTTLLNSRLTWKRNKARPETPPILNGHKRHLEKPQGLGIDYKALKRTALEDFEKRKELIREILAGATAERIETMFCKGRFRLSRSVWAETVYTYLRAYFAACDPTQQSAIVASLKPLYFARVVSFIRETLELDHQESEQEIIRQAQSFWRRRNRLVKAAN